MAARYTRRRDADEPRPDDAADEDADLDDDAHAWWAQREVGDVWRPREPANAEEPERDVLAEHFGDDWRTSFGFDRGDGPSPEEPVAVRAPSPVPADPYAVLEVESSSTWEEIVAAHRRLARRHHPDRLVGRSDVEIAAGEDRIRDINAAYAELRVRRAR
ncbi:MAG: J domain-containing protein [Acidimicrobiales bacterium]